MPEIAITSLRTDPWVFSREPEYTHDLPARINNQVVIDGTPVVGVSRRVLLIDLEQRRVVAQTWSDRGGFYTFDNLAQGRAYVPVSVDHTGQFEAIAAGPVTTPILEG